jgi:peptidyl-dipeptidase Dcp
MARRNDSIACPWRLGSRGGPSLRLRSNVRNGWLVAALVISAMVGGGDSRSQLFAQTHDRDLSSVSSSRLVSMNESNPFFAPSTLPYSAPDFAAVETEHFEPAFAEGMKQQLEEIAAIADQSASPTFENTMVPMERSGAILKRVSAVFFNLTSAHTSPAIQAIEEKIAPQLASHSDNIYLNSKLFARVESLAKQLGTADWNEEQQRLVKETFEGFVRAGARLSEADQARVRAINGELSSLTTQFQNQLLEVTQERAVVIDDITALEGMSEADIAAAQQAATARGLNGKYLLAITNTTRQPVLTSLKNRATRRSVYLASANRAMGEAGGIDNRPLVLQIARLRAERARLLGFENHAAYTLENQMAETPAAATKMLRDLVPGVRSKVQQEAEKISQAMRADGLAVPIEAWDWEYYAEKVRAKEYQVDENAIKPYFELESVLQNGVFYTYGKLYGVSFRERTDLPVWHPTVRVFDVIGADGNPIGLFYADYYQRDSKRGGAWMDALVTQSRLLKQLPVVINVMNIPAPATGEPTLLSLDHVMTMFHELGHGVHGLFSSVEYPTLSGTAVPRDYVEFPSTFHEDWAIEPEVLAHYARHYQTGETIPRELLNKAIEASKFNKGFDSMEYLSAALLDLAWHALTPEQIPEDALAFEQQTLAAAGLDDTAVPPRYRTTYFAHVWSGGYSAGYYAYLWSEILAADAFAFMKTQGGLNPVAGASFRDKILSRGGAREVMQQYIDYRGREPSVDALLIRRGLK